MFVSAVAPAEASNCTIQSTTEGSTEKSHGLNGRPRNQRQCCSRWAITASQSSYHGEEVCFRRPALRDRLQKCGDRHNGENKWFDCWNGKALGDAHNSTRKSVTAAQRQRQWYVRGVLRRTTKTCRWRTQRASQLAREREQAQMPRTATGRETTVGHPREREHEIKRPLHSRSSTTTT